MKCDSCERDLVFGSFITKCGNEIEYTECEECGMITATW